MNYAQQQRDPRRHFVGFTSVIILHILVAYALINGLGRKVVDVLKKPLEVNLIQEEIKKVEPPPPPPPKPQVVRKVVDQPRPLPTPFVPPPEVPVAAPVAPVIAATTTAPPPVEAPPAPPVERHEPVVASVGIACPNSTEVRAHTQYPPQAQRLGLNGEVLIEFTVGQSGEISDINVVRTSNRVFNTAATAAVRQFRCVGQRQPVRVQVPFVFTLDG